MLSIKHITLAISAIFLTSISLFAQENKPRRICLSGINEPVVQFRTTPYLSQAKLKQTSRINTTNLTTIVHIVHLSSENVGNGSNLSYRQIMSQINATNKDLLNINTNRNYTLHEFKDDVADLDIELKMAAFDPEGNELYEPGVNRIVGNPGSKGYFNKSEIRNIMSQNIWDPEKYLNIWVAEINSNYLGYAFFPDYPDLEGIDGLSSDEIASSNEDGVVMHTDYFGSNEFYDFPNLEEPYNLGRTLTHELGHYLGILHIWGLGSSVNDCTKDDYCEDTPMISRDHGSTIGSDFCDGDSSAITNNLCDLEMFSSSQYQNYMDYTDDACMTMFSLDQKLRVDAVLESAPQRYTLSLGVPSGTISLNVSNGSDFHILNWTVTDEEDAVGYIIEKQLENEGYETISPVLDLTTNTYEAYYDPSEYDQIISYRVYLVNRDGYSLSSNVIKFRDGVLSNENIEKESFVIYPNPSKGIFKVNINEYVQHYGILEIWNTNGQKVYTENLSKQEVLIQVDLTQQPIGTYIFKISSDTGIYTQKCIKI